MLSPTSPHMLWTAACNPKPEGAIPYRGRCLWCGQLAGGLGRDRASLPDTFFDAVGKDCADLTAPHLCAACGWTLSDGVTLPHRVGARLLANALDSDGRVCLDLGDGSFRAVVARVGDQVGAWVRPGKAADEARLRANPVVKDAVYLGSQKILATQVTGKFRNFHAFASLVSTTFYRSRYIWEMFTSGEKPALRAIVISPPQGEWTLTIGDGQKHEAIYGEVNYLGCAPAVRFQGSIVRYQPAEMATLIGAVERLSLAGAHEEEILRGRYSRSGFDFALAVRRAEPIVAQHRGGPMLGLALFLRRPAAELRETNAPTSGAEVKNGCDDRPVDGGIAGDE